MKRRLLTLLLALVMLVSLFPATAIAAEAVPGEATEVEFQIDKDKSASREKLDPNRNQTQITLQLPSAEYQNSIDVVFTMDSSSSAQNSSVFTESVNELFNSILENNPNILLKVGVIRFRGRAHDAIAYLSDNTYKELVEYNNETKDYINRALNMTEAEIKAAFGSGSNTHGGIDIANEWLKADTSVEDDHKYIVLLTDGKTYIWNDEDHEPTSIYAQWFRSNSYAIQNGGKPALNQSFAYNKYAYPVDVLDPSGNSNIFVFQTYQALYDSTDPELTGVSAWDEPCRYADGGGVPDGTVVKHETTNGAALFGSNSATYGKKGDLPYWYEFTPNANWEGVTYLEANPFVVIDNGDGTYTFDTATINPNYYLYHVDALSKGMYRAGHLWTEVGEKYHTAVITYSGGSNDSALSTIRPSFLNWLHEADVSEYSADITESSEVEALFEGIDNSIRYLVNSGTVTDEISPYFDLVQEDGVCPFVLTVGGEEIEPVLDGKSWIFNKADKPSYVVLYDAESHTITWDILVPVENAHPVALSYWLEWNDSYVWEEGQQHFAEVDTNGTTRLSFVTTTGESGYSDFDSPTVTYREATVTVTKNWDDSDNQDGIRPKSVDIQLLAGEDPYQDPVQLPIVTQDDAGTAAGADAQVTEDWTYTWTGLPVYSNPDAEDDDDLELIEYTVDELEMPDGYESEIETTTDENTGNIVATITNTHAPEQIEIEIIKVWDDDDNRDGIRPGSVGILVQANKQEYAGVTLPATDDNQEPGTNDVPARGEAGANGEAQDASANEWTTTITAPRYEKGQEISYTVDEVEMPDGYESEIETTTDEKTGNIVVKITNTHKPEAIDLTITKVWDDADDQDGKRPDSVTVQLKGSDKTYTAILNVDGGYLQEAGNGEANGRTGNDPVPTRAAADPTGAAGANGEAQEANPNEWTVTVNVPKYADGKEIDYTVTEDAVEEYTTEIEETETGFTITNTYAPGMTTLTVTKVWDDANNQDGIRPEHVQVQLLANGEACGEPITLPTAADNNGNNATTRSANNDGWTYTWNNLPKYADGNEIVYTVAEEAMDYYTANVTRDADNGFTITNTYEPETTAITVTKVWEDEEDAAEARPESVKVQLYANGEAYGDPVTLRASADNGNGNNVTTRSANNDGWTYTWNDLPVYASGKKIDYTVTEDAVEEYTTEIEETETGFTITNTYAPGMTTLTVEKIWDDQENKYGLRPESVTVKLSLGDEVWSQTLSEENGWKCSWDVTVKDYEADAYKVEEDTVPYYLPSPTIDHDKETGYCTITNKLGGIGGSNEDLLVEKIAEGEPKNGKYYVAGEKIRYKITVKNTGGDVIANITVKDELTGGEWTITLLEVGESKDFTTEYEVTEEDVKTGDGKLLNVVTASVDGSDPKEDPPAEGDTEVPIEEPPAPPTPPTPPSPPTPPTPPTPPELNKTDHYAYIIGNDEGRVTPGANITRAEVATIFFRMLTDESRDEYWSQTNGFSDVFPEEWFNNAISTMANAGILKGYEDGTFRPKASITRAEFATIAIRFFQDFTSTESYFSDVSGHWGEAYINMAAEKGLIKGYPDSTFHPDAAITRAEAMAIMNRLLERHPHKDHLFNGMITWPDNADVGAWYYADVQEATNSHEYTIDADGYEVWTKILPVRDWAAFEKEWSNAHSASNPGDVVGKDFSLDLSELEDAEENGGEPAKDGQGNGDQNIEDQDDQDQDAEDQINGDQNIEDQDDQDQDAEDQINGDQNIEDQDAEDQINGDQNIEDQDDQDQDAEDQINGDGQNADGQSRN